MVTHESICGCQSNRIMLKAGCKSQLEVALTAAADQHAADYAKCRNKGKHSKCVHKAAAKHEAAVDAAITDYNECLKDGGSDN